MIRRGARSAWRCGRGAARRGAGVVRRGGARASKGVTVRVKKRAERVKKSQICMNLLLGSSRKAFMFLMRLPSLCTSAFSSSGTKGLSAPAPPPSVPIRLMRSSYECALWTVLRRPSCRTTGAMLSCSHTAPQWWAGALCEESPGVRRSEADQVQLGHGGPMGSREGALAGSWRA